MRADRLMLQQGHAPTRSAAKRLIERGAVEWAAAAGWTRLDKAGVELADEAVLRITDDAETRWASRGGLKLDGALERTGLDVRGLDCLDVGQSTGGFTDVLLARGARHVVGVDVGRGQLAPRLAADARVTAIEGVNARHLAPGDLPARDYALVVGDLSFISLTLVLPALERFISHQLLLLVKPQFELQPADIGKGGLVGDFGAYARVERRLRDACGGLGLTVRDWFESPITGGDGNTEFFIQATRS